jgi:hypothetical protein
MDDTQIFVGNFIHQKEAKKWWSFMNREIKSFATEYPYSEEASFAWYSKFFSHHLYKAYYGWLEHEFKKYQKTFNTA